MSRRALAALLALGALAACGRHRQDAPAPAADTPPAVLSGAQLGYLEFGKVSEAAAPDVALGGTIDFDDERTARLNAAVPGRVSELLVHVGDHVEADQPLMVLESPEVKAAESEYVRAEADLTVANKAAERAGRLKAVQAIAEKDYLQATEDAQKAAADFDRARAVLERLRIAPGDSSTRYLLRSPVAGTVVERKAVLGMEVSPENVEPLIVVSDLSQVRVNLRVPERQLGLVRAGQPVRVRVDAYPEDFTGTIVGVGAVVDDATRTVMARCVVPNPKLRLKPAMFARVMAQAPPELRLVTVPFDAVLSDGRQSQVVVRGADGALALRVVELGAEVGGRVQVLSGLGVGDEIVTRGAIFAARALESS